MTKALPRQRGYWKFVHRPVGFRLHGSCSGMLLQSVRVEFASRDKFNNTAHIVLSKSAWSNFRVIRTPFLKAVFRVQ